MLAMGLLVAGFSIYRIRYLEGEAARRYQEVVQARLQLQELSAQLVSAQEENGGGCRGNCMMKWGSPSLRCSWNWET